MKKSDVKALPSMPLQSPTFPRGPYRFFNRQYLVINYKTDPALIREALPEPLEPAGDDRCDRLRNALVGDVGHLDARGHREQHAREMLIGYSSTIFSVKSFFISGSRVFFR